MRHDNYRWPVRCRNNATGGLRTLRHAPRSFHGALAAVAGFAVLYSQTSDLDQWRTPVLLVLMITYLALMLHALFAVFDDAYE